MQVKLKKHARRIDEALSLASKAVSNKDYQADKVALLSKYNFEYVNIEQMMDVRTKILKQFNQDFQDKRDVLEYFFKQRSDMFTLAKVFIETPFFLSEKRKCRVVLDEEQNHAQIMVEVFTRLHLLDDSEVYKAYSIDTLIAILESMDILDEDKWVLQNIYVHLEKEMKRFCSLVNTIVDWLGQFEQEICDEEAAFYDYWNNYLSNVNVREHFTGKLNIDIPSNTNIIWITPAYFSCTVIDNHYEGQNLYVDLGVAFDRHFSFESKYETVQSLCAQLKIISDPSKFEIIKAIKQRPYYGSELAKMFHLSTPTISHHVGTLENAGFIKAERKENKTFYSLDEERLSFFLGQVRHLLLDKDN